MTTKFWDDRTGGTWAVDANWSPTGQPGSGDDAVITGVDAGSTVAGPGSARNLTLLGQTVLSSGGFGLAGSLVVGDEATPSFATLLGGATVTAATASLLYGRLSVQSGRLQVMGTLTAGYASPLDTLSVIAGGVVRATGVTLAASATRVSVDGTSVLEVGTAGGALPGAVTVDARALLFGAGAITASRILVNGTIRAEGGILLLNGRVSGTGSIEIGAGATLAEANAYQAPVALPVTFTGPAGTLAISLSRLDPLYLIPQLSQQAPIFGFAPGDTITLVGGNVSVPTRATLQRSSGAVQVILTSGSSSVNAVALALGGEFAGQNFVLLPSVDIANTVYLIVQANGSGAAGSGTAAPDAYSWSGTSRTSWQDAANWLDLTVGGSALVPPGSRNVVSITGAVSGVPLLVNGPGAAASLALLNGVALAGAFTAGSLDVGTLATKGTASVVAASQVAAGAVNVANGTLSLNGDAARLTVDGGLAVGGATTTQGSGQATTALRLVAGASARVGALSLAQTSSMLGFTSVAGSTVVSIDADSSLNVGAVGGAAPGRLVVDAGHTVAGTGSITAYTVVDNGVILARGGSLSLSGAISGTGALEIDAGVTLSAGDCSVNVSFIGAGGTFETGLYDSAPFISSSTRLLQSGSVSGFLPGDRILINSGVQISRFAYDSAAGLVLGGGQNGLATAGTLRLVGDYSGATFGVSSVSFMRSYIYTITVSAGPASDALFDAKYYLGHNVDIAAGGVDPWQHYRDHGWREGRDPSAYFSTSYYLAHNPDIAAGGLNPLLHFEANGWTEGRDPSANFSLSNYLAANPDLRGVDPLLHFIQNGKSEGRVAYVVGTALRDPLIDSAYYYAQNPDIRSGGLDATDHFLANGWTEGRNPDAFFDVSYYLSHNPDVSAAHIDPLLHYEADGWREGRDPSAAFSTSKYLAAYSDIRAGGIDPLLHYVQYGRAEGRMAFPV